MTGPWPVLEHQTVFRYDRVITSIDNDVKTCEDVSDTLQGLTTKIETTSNNEPELFVTVKKAKKSMHEGQVFQH